MFIFNMQKERARPDAKKSKAARGKEIKLPVDQENVASDMNRSGEFEVDVYSDSDDHDFSIKGSMDECAGYSLFDADGEVMNVVCPHDQAEVVRPVSKVGPSY